MENPYIKGQKDLIQDIKKRVMNLEQTTTITDLAFDIIDLLKNLEPVNEQVHNRQ